MDWVYLHLVLNHFPTILVIAGTLAAIAAVLSRSPGIWRYAYTTVLLAGLTAPVAYVTGQGAEERTEQVGYAEEAQLERHEASGLVATIALLVAAGAAALAWWRPQRGLRVLFVVTALAAAALTGLAAFQGGKIVHESPALVGGRSAPADAAPRAGPQRGPGSE